MLENFLEALEANFILNGIFTSDINSVFHSFTCEVFKSSMTITVCKKRYHLNFVFRVAIVFSCFLKGNRKKNTLRIFLLYTNVCCDFFFF